MKLKILRHAIATSLLAVLLALLVSQASDLKHAPKGCLATIIASKLTDSDLLIAALALNNGSNPKLFVGSVYRALQKLAGISKTAPLSKPDLLRVIQKLKDKLGDDDFEQVVGTQLASVSEALSAGQTQKKLSASTDELELQDIKDLNRGWGWLLLPRDDPTYREPKYQVQIAKAAGASANVMGLSYDLNQENAEFAFKTAWESIAPQNVRVPKIFALTGTDANNLLYEIANEVALRKYNHPPHLGEAEILVFSGAYGGGGGRIERVGMLHPKYGFDDLKITSPDSVVLDPKDPAEVARLKPLEEKALAEIEKKVKKGSPPIGGILLEPILGAKGVRYYRTEFLLRVRKLCDQLQIPIFADEILTGGGRTGKFFSYQHYQGFEPDAVTFGKGLLVAGVTFVDRQGVSLVPGTYGCIGRLVTLHQYTEILLKSAQTINRIREGHLMENITKSGRYFVQRIQGRAIKSLRTRVANSLAKIRQLNSDIAAKGHSWNLDEFLNLETAELAELEAKLKTLEESDLAREEVAHGIGGLIYINQNDILSNLIPPDVSVAMGRLLPPLTLTKKQVDEIIRSR